MLFPKAGILDAFPRSLVDFEYLDGINLLKKVDFSDEKNRQKTCEIQKHSLTDWESIIQSKKDYLSSYFYCP